MSPLAEAALRDAPRPAVAATALLAAAAEVLADQMDPSEVWDALGAACDAAREQWSADHAN